MKIFLLGFMGTGKSYWGAKWATRQGLHFVDLDAFIEEKEGLSVAAIFEQKGEIYFREKEKELLHSFEHLNNFILSTGGGTPCFYDNMQWMNQVGITVYLQTPTPVLVQRLLLEKEHRPLISALKDEELETFIDQRLQQRSPFYAQAQITLSTELITDTTFDQIKRSYV